VWAILELVRKFPSWKSSKTEIDFENKFKVVDATSDPAIFKRELIETILTSVNVDIFKSTENIANLKKCTVLDALFELERSSREFLSVEGSNTTFPKVCFVAQLNDDFKSWNDIKSDELNWGVAIPAGPATPATDSVADTAAAADPKLRLISNRVNAKEVMLELTPPSPSTLDDLMKLVTDVKVGSGKVFSSENVSYYDADLATIDHLIEKFAVYLKGKSSEDEGKDQAKVRQEMLNEMNVIFNEFKRESFLDFDSIQTILDVADEKVRGASNSDPHLLKLQRAQRPRQKGV
jgi:hypothetical protein